MPWNSRIDVATESKDRPHWMGTIDFSGLKIKLIGSLVAISVIELLKDFIELSGEAEVGEGTIWRVIIHLTFVLSGVLFARACSAISAPERAARRSKRITYVCRGTPACQRSNP